MNETDESVDCDFWVFVFNIGLIGRIGLIGPISKLANFIRELAVFTPEA